MRRRHTLDLLARPAWIALIGILGLIALAAAAGSARTATAAPRDTSPITIGVMGALTGPLASYGVDAQKSYQLAVDQRNAKGGVLGRQVQLDNQDSKGDPAVAAQIAQKFVDENTAGVLGDVLSTACLSAAPVLNRAGMPYVTAECSNPQLSSQGFTSFFRVIYRDDQQGGFAGTYARTKLHARTAVVINDTSAYSTGSGAAFVKAFKKSGGRILSVEQITPGNKDFTAVLSKVAGEHPDLIHFTGFYTEGGILVKEARQMKIHSTLFFGGANIDPSFIKIAGSAVKGVLVTGTPTPEQLKGAKAFVATYRAKFGQDPGPYDHFVFDAANVLMNAIAKAGSTDHAAIVRALRQTHYNGASGLITFGNNGDRRSVPFIVMIYNAKGNLSIYKPKAGGK